MLVKLYYLLYCLNLEFYKPLYIKNDITYSNHLL